MSKTAPTFSSRLFYSYSHRDAAHRQSMEEALSLLQRQGLLNTWSDLSIVPGQRISERIREEINNANIIVFLLSHHFIASNACMEEWGSAKKRAQSALLFRVPIILSDCPWPDLLNDDDIKALPDDASPIDRFSSRAQGWQQVYNGIKTVIHTLRTTFTPKIDFQNEIERTHFVARNSLQLRELFSFPTLHTSPSKRDSGRVGGRSVNGVQQILVRNLALIHGPELSGKTSLVRFIYLSLLDDGSPSLFVDLQEIGDRGASAVLFNAYSRQFEGDYDLWKRQKDKTLIVDNLTSATRSIRFLVRCREVFEKIIVTCSTHIFHAFFEDDERLIGFTPLEIQPLDHNQQEQLIRDRLSLVEGVGSDLDGRVDQAETHVNSVIISRKIVPRYPFFVLSIMQTYESYMPEMHVTSYGYCYHV